MVMLSGAGSVGQRSSGTGGAKPNFKKWEITEMTPGAIALAAILVNHLSS